MLDSKRGFVTAPVLCTMLAALAAVGVQAADWTLIGWNDLGMHCMDADYSVFAILPPYNTVHAQLIDANGHRVTDPGGVTVTYEAVADPGGSINRTSAGKTDFWQHVEQLFGVSPAVDTGLAGFSMPGPENRPQPMEWQADHQWFTAEGVPLTPRDDSGDTNHYPLMRLVARSSGGAVLATTDVVLPISDEMDCRLCHASGSGAAARPIAGWVDGSDPVRDYRLNILRLHDDRQEGEPAFATALAAAGYSADGLEATATVAVRPILCAACHGSNALPGTGVNGVAPLTRAVHFYHASVVDPMTGGTLDQADARSACYRCHPGADTRCLRGAMGRAIGGDGLPAMQCQSCHGSMSRVGAASRQGWLEEPACQSCHTGTATANNGQIRYLDVHEPSGDVRQAVDRTFATNPDVPAAGLSLYRFSVGHGGLQCEACHGSTHAVFPSAERNDNLQSEALQGHAGMLVECGTCHPSQPTTVAGGPHGLHPVGNSWANGHGDAAEGRTSQCAACHGADFSGTVLSFAQAERTLTTELGTRRLWRGFRVGCYACHDGPTSERANPNRAPTVSDATAETTAGTLVTIPLQASDADAQPLTLRVVGQPSHGAAWISGRAANYRSEQGFVGSDSFTYAAFDGMIDSNLGGVTVTVTAGGAVAASSMVVAARGPGADGSQWRTDLVVLNPRDASVAMTMTYADGQIEVARSSTLAAGATTEWRDVLSSLFGLAGQAGGVVRIDSTAPVLVSTRIYNTAATGEYGQYFPAVSASRAVAAGTLAAIPNLKRNGQFRSNLGFLNLSGAACDVRVVVHDAAGAQIGSPLLRTVPAGQWLQIDDVIGQAGAGDRDLSWATVEVLTAGGEIWAYASVISRDSSDPITVPVEVVE